MCLYYAMGMSYNYRWTCTMYSNSACPCLAKLVLHRSRAWRVRAQAICLLAGVRVESLLGVQVAEVALVGDE